LRILVLPADTTPPMLTGAAARDSVTLRLEFDDPLDPEVDLAEVTLAVRDTLTGEPRDVVELVVGTPPPPEPEIDPEEADAELIPPDAEPDEPIEIEAEEPVEPGLEPAADHLTVRLAQPLAPGVYEVEISGVANLLALQGGGSATFQYERPPEPDPKAGAEVEGEAEGDPQEAEPEP
jgi:hypothetical protein